MYFLFEPILASTAYSRMIAYNFKDSLYVNCWPLTILAVPYVFKINSHHMVPTEYLLFFFFTFGSSPLEEHNLLLFIAKIGSQRLQLENRGTGLRIVFLS